MLRGIAHNPFLQEIHLLQVPAPNEGSMDCRTFYSNVGQPLRDLIVFHPEISNSISLPSNPLFVPMAHVNPNIRDTIWAHILGFSLEVDIYKDGSTRFSPQMLQQLTRTHTSISQVSKDFRVSQNPLPLPSMFNPNSTIIRDSPFLTSTVIPFFRIIHKLSPMQGIFC